jgi:uncharacterized protein
VRSASLPMFKAPPPPAAAQGAPPWFHVIEGTHPLVLLVGASRLFQLDLELADRLRAGRADALEVLRELEVPRATQPLALPEPVSLSLNIAQICNLACDYCYADEGRFGGGARQMSEEIALRAIDRAIDAAAGRRVTIGFIGGEPFLHRALLHRCVGHARDRAAAASVPISFSVATNGTLLRDDDVALLRAHDFAVSVSLDGGADIHDRHRPRVGGGGSHARALAAVAPLLAAPGRARVAARATITRDDLRVAERLGALLDAGFLEVGVSPARTGPDASLVLCPEDWPVFLAEMIRAARLELARLRASGVGDLRFSNLGIALKEIYRGSCRALPCGAAQSYVSLGADGRYYTCHRTIGQPGFALGDLETGPSAARRRAFLEARDVDRQEPCRTCWARYLCGGGCHAEVIAAGRDGCDYIRGWLEFCLATYSDLLDELPHLFTSSPGVGS